MDDTTQQEPDFASEAFHNPAPHDHTEDLPHTGPDETPETENPSEALPDHSGSSHHQLRSGWFSHAHNLNISGGRFVKHIHHTAVPAGTPGKPPVCVSGPSSHAGTDFRVIPVGDLDLRREIRFNSATGVVDRRMHAARIYGSKSKMNVAIYEGDNTEEVCLNISLAEFMHWCYFPS
ncbi:hypothetical protein B0H17DRAFT_1092222 [Mycena rosella]|uniref:Uncharacterized protein n=1 Tax=Mycena rosella TaxID=1033263 RepID=A0AAD7CUR5_MYCRO|nr:hypothetical protein B0H17DRAFT_1092222 [Mycena rosella]